MMEVGSWYPITDDDGPTEKIDVRTDVPAEEEKLKKDAIRHREEESARIMRELKERTEEIKSSKDINEEEDSLDYYVMKYVTWMRIKENIDQFANKLKDLESKWRSTRQVLAKLDEAHPEYNKVWLDRYNEERRKTKIPDFIPGDDLEELYQKKITE